MDSVDVLRRAATAILVYERELDENEKAIVARATDKVAEWIRLIEAGRLDVKGATPAEIAKMILGHPLASKPCVCPSCRAWKIFD